MTLAKKNFNTCKNNCYWASQCHSNSWWFMFQITNDDILLFSYKAEANTLVRTLRKINFNTYKKYVKNCHHFMVDWSSVGSKRTFFPLLSRGVWLKKRINLLLFPPSLSAPSEYILFIHKLKKETELEQISKDQWMNFQEYSGLTNHIDNNGNCRDHWRPDGKNRNMPPPQGSACNSTPSVQKV